jgi:hypothetical protein
MYVIFADAHRATVMIFLEATVAQNIFIGSVAGNRRIERAIPRFMSRFGMAKDQATAVAIRLESIGRLKDSGAPVNKPASTKGQPIPVTPFFIQQALQNMKKIRQPRRTQVTEPTDDVYTSPYAVQSTRSNRLRNRVTRGRRG